MKPSRSMRVGIACVSLAASLCAAAAADEPTSRHVPRAVESAGRFSGAMPVAKTLASGRLRIEIRDWMLAGGVKLDALDLPMRGLLVVQLRGGELTTIIDGQRVERTEAEFWTVPPGVAMGLVTEDDSAIIQTIAVEHAAARGEAGYADRATPRGERMFAQYAHGILARTVYVTRTPTMRIEIRDLLVGPGGKTGAVDLRGAALLEVRSGRGVLHEGDARDALTLGTTRTIGPDRGFSIENLEQDRALQIRAIVVLPPG